MLRIFLISSKTDDRPSPCVSDSPLPTANSRKSLNASFVSCEPVELFKFLNSCILLYQSICEFTSLSFLDMYLVISQSRFVRFSNWRQIRQAMRKVWADSAPPCLCVRSGFLGRLRSSSTPRSTSEIITLVRGRGTKPLSPYSRTIAFCKLLASESKKSVNWLRLFPCISKLIKFAGLLPILSITLSSTNSLKSGKYFFIISE